MEKRELAEHLKHEQALMLKISELAPCPWPMSLIDMLVDCAGTMEAKAARRAREDHRLALANERALEDQMDNNIRAADMHYGLLSKTSRF